ncbi:MAG: UDP-N-acetylmuramate--L-alanine ligase [bacterium]|nr:UDP-N-acetylmuramate--L-alanine ligase [bacterium]
MKAMIDLTAIKHIHMVGVGGIGLSALARLMVHDGKKITGSDTADGRIVRELRAFGIEIQIGSWTEMAREADLLVYSKAVAKDDEDRVAARKEKVPEIEYPLLLGLVSQHKKTIAITGTHGKTTTTAMLACIAKEAGLDPTAIVGSIVQDFKSNLLVGGGDYLITEACEYRRSFLSLHPYVLVITNIDLDHLDYYKDMADIQSAFSKLTDQVVPGGVVVYDSRDPHQAPVIAHLLKTAASREISLVDYSTISLPVNLTLFGLFNQYNAQAALATAGAISIDEEAARMTLKHFSGTWRRQEFKGETRDHIKVYDDYGHNPTEIRANIAAFRTHFASERIVVVFQPHLYSRTHTFLHEFAQSFDDADVVIVLPIYAAREADTYETTQAMLVETMRLHHPLVQSASSFDEAWQLVKAALPDGSVVVTQGAGDGYIVGDMLLEN